MPDAVSVRHAEGGLRVDRTVRSFVSRRSGIGAQPPLMSAATRGQNPRDCAGQQWPLNDRQPTFAIGRRRAHGWRSPGTDRVRRQLPLSYRSPSETYIGQNG
jgi:hypothetical protein